MHFREVKGILSSSNGMNIYRGCTHGCIYCDSRSACYRMDHDFEDICVKANAVSLLEDTLRRKRKKCMIGTGAMTDPYIPEEITLQSTRQSLEVILRHGFGLCIQTKSDRILRDMDLLKAIHKRARCVVQMTLTTWDDALSAVLEPGVCTTRRRVEVLKAFQTEGIPTVVWLCPLLPWVNDTPENLLHILRACEETGVYGIITFGMGLTLREGSREYFYARLEEHFPGLAARYHAVYGNSYEIPSPREKELQAILRAFGQRTGIDTDQESVFRWMRKWEEPTVTEQLSLF